MGVSCPWWAWQAVSIDLSHTLPSRSTNSLMNPKKYTKKIIRSPKRFPDKMQCYFCEFHCSWPSLFHQALPLEMRPSRPLLLVFSCEKWKLPQKWLQRLSQRGYVAAAVEAKPLLHTKDFGATTSTAPTGTWHCNSDWWMLGDFSPHFWGLVIVLVEVKHQLHLKWIEKVVICIVVNALEICW